MKLRSTLPTLLFLAAAACGGDDDGAAPVDAARVDAPAVIDAPLAIDSGGIDAAPVAGDLCSNAEPITLTLNMATITATTAAPFTHNYEPGGCAMVNSMGPDRVHSLTVPASMRLTATVDPTSATFDPGIFLIAGPAASCDAMPIVCLTQNDNGGDGANDAITFDNTTGNPADVFIMIDGFRPDGDAYTLTVTVGPIL